MDDRIVRCGIISSCQSAATSEIVKALLVASLTHVRGAIASTRALPLPLSYRRLKRLAFGTRPIRSLSDTVHDYRQARD